MRLALVPACLVLASLVVLAPPPAAASQDTLLTVVRKLPDVIEAKIDSRGTLWAMVKNNRTSWDDYAESLCLLARLHKGRIFTATVVDITTVGSGRDPDSWKQLSAYKCSSL